jgi:hypothetical protein
LKDSFLITQLDFMGEVSKAKQVWRDGTIIEGRYEHGKFNGFGRIIHSNGDYYIGNFVNNLAEGNGTFESATGYYYQGEFETNTPHGNNNSSEFHRHRVLLQHQWWILQRRLYERKNVNFLKLTLPREGFGKFTQQLKGEYHGEFVENKFSGVGTYKWLDGRMYEGHWHNGKRHGMGSFTFKDGGVYKGSYECGMKHGYGTLTVANGVGYEGHWKNNEYTGVGVLRQSDKILMEGDWEAGQFVPLNGGLGV